MLRCSSLHFFSPFDKKIQSIHGVNTTTFPLKPLEAWTKTGKWSCDFLMRLKMSLYCLSGPAAVGQPFSFWTPVTTSSWSSPWLIQSVCESEREIKEIGYCYWWLIDWYWGDSCCSCCMLGFGDVRTSMQLSQRQRAARDREKEKRAVSTLVQAILRFMKLSESPFLLSLSHCPSEKWKAGCAGLCSESVPRATGVLTGMLLEGCGLVSPPGEVFSWDWEEEDEEWVLSLELLRVSVLVLVFFIFLLLASGALSTVCRRKPSRLHLLNAWDKKKGVSQISQNYSFSKRCTDPALSLLILIWGICWYKDWSFTSAVFSPNLKSVFM